MYVLLVEHDAGLAVRICRLLAKHGMEVDIASSSGDAESKAHQHDRNAVAIVDAAWPDVEGYEVLRTLRAGGHTLPIMLFTSPGAVEDRVRGLELGADDCLAKPFAAPELVARLRAMARRASREPAELRLGGLAMDIAARQAWVNGCPIRLPPREWNILEYLMRHAACAVSREDIIDAVSSPDKRITCMAVDVSVSRIRQKIADARVTIRAICGMGYVLATAAP